MLQRGRCSSWPIADCAAKERKPRASVELKGPPADEPGGPETRCPRPGGRAIGPGPFDPPFVKEGGFPLGGPGPVLQQRVFHGIAQTAARWHHRKHVGRAVDDELDEEGAVVGLGLT